MNGVNVRRGSAKLWGKWDGDTSSGDNKRGKLPNNNIQIAFCGASNVFPMLSYTDEEFFGEGRNEMVGVGGGMQGGKVNKRAHFTRLRRTKGRGTVFAWKEDEMGTYSRVDVSKAGLTAGSEGITEQGKRKETNRKLGGGK